jgi:hypothetical protein
VKTADEFYDFCEEHFACEEGLEAIKGLTFAEWWAKTDRGDWMMWLKNEGLWSFSLEQRKAYKPKRDLLAADYNAKLAPLWEDYYNTNWDTLWGNYYAKQDTLAADYYAKRAMLLREIVGESGPEVQP